MALSWEPSWRQLVVVGIVTMFVGSHIGARLPLWWAGWLPWVMVFIAAGTVASLASSVEDASVGGFVAPAVGGFFFVYSNLAAPPIHGVLNGTTTWATVRPFLVELFPQLLPIGAVFGILGFGVGAGIGIARFRPWKTDDERDSRDGEPIGSSDPTRGSEMDDAVVASDKDE